MKTPEELAVRYSDLREFADRRLDYKAKLLLEQGFLAGYQAAQDQFADTSKVIPQWISVKERLPRPGQEVLVFDKSKISVRAISSNGTWHPYYSGFRCEPSFWQPLPEPPKEEK